VLLQVKPVPLKFSRTTISDDTRLPHSRGMAAAAAGNSAPPTLMTWSDPGREGHPAMGAGVPGAAGVSAAGAVSAHFPRGPAQLPPPLVAVPQHVQHAQHSMGGSLGGPPLLPPQQAPPHGGLFGPFPPPPYGECPAQYAHIISAHICYVRSRCAGLLRSAPAATGHA
jgi:hypothetical protein